MTPAEIIAMAHEAAPDLTWFAATEDPREAAREELAFLTRFATMVAAKEREACKNACQAVAALHVSERPAPKDQAYSIVLGASLCVDAISARQ
jgi:hypothetical protein